MIDIAYHLINGIYFIADWLWGSRMTSLFGLLIAGMYALLLFLLHRADELEPYYIAQRLYYSLPTAFFGGKGQGPRLYDISIGINRSNRFYAIV